ncbi:MAG: hypothetical protein UU73_C0005G0022 [Candidatus Daviesbacteria bacterium GW2011_GWA1_41_61]|uniref:Uncharacterized protein n=1 Tax=Candidatus Daviesbacteria bacterium GW2011_GWA2_40_9 TaxID=1618424 RepID=A0A0G0U3M2_9BACT|nr:MAG: hypothetical protein UU29_C0003G0051 [Candidatus Daviesbacteria bacterium GW2011_GWA2_40_9]KKR92692.1 MAG: hypothetical protein UU44_C0005G0022 [Candidatus Daviesbacteria bacterium GW2011_GWB1_41_15]KKS14623.1 MAG: hypothetical protein UU73_C0005G0022 [Candidatus Daviesbacteria bacterium GW2011_GWA1_41_61]
MHTKSKMNLNEPFANMTADEAFRAAVEAFSQGNFDLVEEMRRQLPNETKKEVDKLISLFLRKLMLYSGYIIIRADTAITFYNDMFGQIFGVEAEKFDPDSAFKLLESTQKIKEQIAELDREAKGALNLDRFEVFKDEEMHSNYWMHILQEIGKKYGDLVKSDAWKAMRKDLFRDIKKSP